MNTQRNGAPRTRTAAGAIIVLYFSANITERKLGNPAYNVMLNFEKWVSKIGFQKLILKIVFQN